MSVKEQVRIDCECCGLGFMRRAPNRGWEVGPFQRCGDCRRECPPLAFRNRGEACHQEEQPTREFDPLEDW